MSNTNDTQTSINDLQSRIAFQEDTIASLNIQLASQDKILLTLQKQMQHLNEKINTLSHSQNHEEANSGIVYDELPPHY